MRRVGRRRFASIPGYGTGTAAAVAAVADAAAHATRAHPPFDHKWVKVVGGLRILPLLVLRPDCAAQTGRACLGGVPSRASAASAPISSGSTIACYHACILQPPDAAPRDHALWSRAWIRRPSTALVLGHPLAAASGSGTRQGAGAIADNAIARRHRTN